MTNVEALKQWVESKRSEWLAALQALVCHESPSRDKPSLDPLALALAERLQAIGGRTEIHENPDGGNHLSAWFFDAQPEVRPTLVVGHFDTVWPLGTLAQMPFRVEGSTAFGPGVYDMKASLVEVEFALRALLEAGLMPPRPIHVLLTSDEEVGSPTSRLLIEAAARQADRALIVEPPLADGSLKTARKGVGNYTIEVEGKAAHAGVEPKNGISAIHELARHVLYLHALTDHDSGLSVNVGVIEGGTTSNVVPAHARARVDVRATSMTQADVIDSVIRQVEPFLPGARLRIEGGFNRPPMERTEATVALFEQARQLALELGFELGEGSTGGGSDGNFTSAQGTPTLDGLGIKGAGAHASHEQVDLDSFAERTSLLAGLLLHP